MSSALFFLITRSWLNSVRTKLRRLREPKYLVAMVVGVLWFGLAFGSILFRRSGSPTSILGPESASLIVALLSSIVLLLFGWVSPISKGALNLTENEAAWLFAAPLGRGALYSYHVFKYQLGLCITSFLLSLWWHRQTGAPQGSTFVAVWLMWNFVSLHNFAMAIVWQDLASKPVVIGVLKTVSALVFFSLLALLGKLGWDAYQLDCSYSATPDFPLLQKVLTPVKWITAPLTAQSWTGMIASCGPLLMLGALAWWIIVHGRTPWVEVTLEQIVVREERLASVRAGRPWWSKPKRRVAQEEIFHLPSTGPVWKAFLWKWGLHTGGWPKIRERFGWVLFLLAMVVAGVLAVDQAKFINAHGDMMVLGGLFYLGIILPAVAVVPAKITQQLRADLNHMDILSTLPTKPQEMLIGILIGPLVQTVLITWCVIATAALVLWLRPSFPLITPELVICGWVGACLILTALVPTICFIQCLLAIAFPAWQPMDRKAGIDNMGVGMLAMIILFGIFTLTAALSFALCSLVYLLGGSNLPLPAQALLASLITTIVITLEGWAAFRWASHLLWRYDPSEKSVGLRKSR